MANFETVAPPASNVLPAVPPDGGAGIPGGRSLPPAGRNGSARCQGDGLQTRAPANIGTSLAGVAGQPSILSDTPASATTELGNDGVPTVFQTSIGDGSALVSGDADGAGNSAAHPARRG
jgi:hypothetical protein